MPELDLPAFRGPLEEALRQYEVLHENQLNFSAFPDLVLTPDKPNSARTIIPVTHKETKVGEMYVIVFRPGDGTGDSKTYTLDQLRIPPKYRYIEKPARVLPRSKQGIICEGFFPLFSIGQNHPEMFAVSLEELTVDDVSNLQTIVRAWTLNNGNQPTVYQTTGMDLQSRRFGDPHAIHNATNKIQVAGFLAVTDQESSLISIAKNWNLPLGYK